MFLSSAVVLSLIIRKKFRFSRKKQLNKEIGDVKGTGKQPTTTMTAITMSTEGDPNKHEDTVNCRIRITTGIAISNCKIED